MKKIIFIFIFDDIQEHIREFRSSFAEKFEDGIIVVNDIEYTVKFIQGISFEECIKVLSDPEHIKKGGIVLLDVVFDDNHPQNPEMISLNMLENLKKSLGVDTLPYAIIFRSANIQKVITHFLKNDDIVRFEKLGFIDKLCGEGESQIEQFKNLLPKFQENYSEVDGIWRRTNKINDWLKKYEIEFSQIKVQALENLKNVLNDKTLKDFPEKQTRIQLNEIIAIEKVKIKIATMTVKDKEVSTYMYHYVIYPRHINVLPFFVKNIKFQENTFTKIFPELKKNIRTNDIWIDDIWNKFNPTTEDKYKRIVSLYEKEALPFLVTHGNFLTIMPFYMEKCTEKQLPKSLLQKFSIYKWTEGVPTENWAKNRYNNRGGYIKCFRGNSEVYFPFGGGQNGEVNTAKWQQDIITTALERHRDWYSRIREVK
jgi:hypothetical protein